MLKEIELINSLKKINKSTNVILPGKVISVNKNNFTCKVEFNENIYVDDVKLQALESFNEGIVVIPEENSYVLVGKILNSDQYFILAYTSIEKILIKIKNTELITSDEGIKFKFKNTELLINDYISVKTTNESLLELLANLIDLIMQLTVPTGTGPSGTPINASLFNQLKQRLNNILN